MLLAGAGWDGAAAGCDAATACAAGAGFAATAGCCGTGALTTCRTVAVGRGAAACGAGASEGAGPVGRVMAGVLTWPVAGALTAILGALRLLSAVTG